MWRVEDGFVALSRRPVFEAQDGHHHRYGGNWMLRTNLGTLESRVLGGLEIVAPTSA